MNYYNFKEEHPEIHQQLNPKEMRHIGDDNVITVPPYRTQCGRRLLIYRMGNWKPSKYPVEELFKATISVLELGILEPRAQILGGIVIFDLKNITMAHAWTVTPQVHFVLTFFINLFLYHTRAQIATNVITNPFSPGGNYDVISDGDRVSPKDTRVTHYPTVVDF